jgi:hypothetical protein
MNKYQFKYDRHNHLVTIKIGMFGVTLPMIGPTTAWFLRTLVRVANGQLESVKSEEKK